MIKKLLLVLGPVAAVVALSIVPMSASADVFWKCPAGVTDHKYCTKIIKCKVPNLRGKTPGDSDRILRIHDCRRGKTSKAKGNGVKVGQILKSVPGPGSVLARNAQVNIIVRK